MGLIGARQVPSGSVSRRTPEKLFKNQNHPPLASQAFVYYCPITVNPYSDQGVVKLFEPVGQSDPLSLGPHESMYYTAPTKVSMAYCSWCAPPLQYSSPLLFKPL